MARPARVVTLANAAILLNDQALNDKCKLAFLDRLRFAAELDGDDALLRRARPATAMLRGVREFDLAWRAHLWPALMSTGQLDNSTTDANIIAECDRLILGLADVNEVIGT